MHTSTDQNPTRPRRSRRRHAAALGVAALAVLALPACGDSDDDAATTTAPAADAGEHGDGHDDSEAFCDLAYETDAKVNAASGGPEGEPDAAAVEEATAALDEFVDAAPDSAKPIATELAAATNTMFEQPGPPSEALLTSFAQLAGWVGENCDVEVVDVTAEDYHFTGLPDEVPAGRVVVQLDNTGTEVHEMVVFRIEDDSIASAADVLELPEDEAMSKVTMLGAAFALPGAEGGGLFDLSEGRYGAICFLPVGSTSMEALMGDAGGPPHAMQGMVADFTVG